MAPWFIIEDLPTAPWCEQPSRCSCTLLPAVPSPARLPIGDSHWDGKWINVTLSCPPPLFHITFSAVSWRGKFLLRGAAIEGSWSFVLVWVVRIPICAGWVQHLHPPPRGRTRRRQGHWCPFPHLVQPCAASFPNLCCSSGILRAAERPTAPVDDQQTGSTCYAVHSLCR